MVGIFLCRSCVNFHRSENAQGMRWCIHTHTNTREVWSWHHWHGAWCTLLSGISCDMCEKLNKVYSFNGFSRLNAQKMRQNEEQASGGVCMCCCMKVPCTEWNFHFSIFTHDIVGRSSPSSRCCRDADASEVSFFFLFISNLFIAFFMPCPALEHTLTHTHSLSLFRPF